MKHLDVFIEQPCLSYEECLSIRPHCPLPFIIDESMDDINMLVSQSTVFHEFILKIPLFQNDTPLSIYRLFHLFNLSRLSRPSHLSFLSYLPCLSYLLPDSQGTNTCR